MDCVQTSPSGENQSDQDVDREKDDAHVMSELQATLLDAYTDLVGERVRKVSANMSFKKKINRFKSELLTYNDKCQNLELK